MRFRECLIADNGDRLRCGNRGVLITPFHNMMLVSPATSRAQVDLLLAGFEQFVDEYHDYR